MLKRKFTLITVRPQSKGREFCLLLRVDITDVEAQILILEFHQTVIETANITHRKVVENYIITTLDNFTPLSNLNKHELAFLKVVRLSFPTSVKIIL